MTDPPRRPLPRRLERDRPEARRAAVADLYADDGRYIDPLVDAEGRARSTRRSAPSRRSSPASSSGSPGRSTPTTTRLRFTWELGPAGRRGADRVGFDVAVAGRRRPDPRPCSASSTGCPATV